MQSRTGTHGWWMMSTVLNSFATNWFKDLQAGFYGLASETSNRNQWASTVAEVGNLSGSSARLRTTLALAHGDRVSMITLRLHHDPSGGAGERTGVELSDANLAPRVEFGSGRSFFSVLFRPCRGQSLQRL
jgi:hypothetical protein